MHNSIYNIAIRLMAKFDNTLFLMWTIL